jgi:hypothetical protein
VAVIAHRLELYIYGTDSAEIWRDVANETGSPFERLPGAVVPKGCKAKHTLREVDNTLVWVANDNTVCRNYGYEPKIISNFAVSRAIESDPNPSDLEADVWSENGHTFYALSGTDWTWVLDFATGEWHERRSYKSDRWRGRGVMRAFNKNLVGSRDDGYLYDMDTEARKEGDAPVVCVIRIPSFNIFPDSVDYHNINIWAVTGRTLLGNTTARMTLRWSDTGDSFHGVRQISLGPRAQRNIRIKANQLGSSRRKVPRTWELEFSDDHVVAIQRVAVNVEANQDG